MSVTRYDLDNREDVGFMAPEDGGDWVRYDDYRALEAERDELRERIKHCAVGPCPVLAALALKEFV